MKKYNKLIDTWLKMFLNWNTYQINKGEVLNNENCNKTIKNVESFLENVNIENITSIQNCNSWKRIREGLEDELQIKFKKWFEVIIWSSYEHSLKKYEAITEVNKDGFYEVSFDLKKKEDWKRLGEIIRKEREKLEKENFDKGIPWYTPQWLKQIKENNKYFKMQDSTNLTSDIKNVKKLLW